MNQKTTLFKIFFTYFLDMLAFGILIPIFPFLFSTDESSIFSSRFSESEMTLLYGWLMGIFTLAIFLGAPILGALSDKLGRRKLLMLAHFVNLISYLLLAWGVSLASLTILFIARVIGGLLGPTLTTVQSAIADISTKEEKTKNFGITGVAFGLGFVSGVAIMVGMSNISGFTYTWGFIVAAIITFFNLLFIIYSFPETLKHFSNKPLNWLSGFQNIQQAFQRHYFRLLFGVIFIMTIGVSFFSQFFQFYLIDHFKLNVTHVGLIFIYSGILIAITQGVFLPILSKRYSPEKIMYYGLILFGFSFLLLLIPDSVLGLYLVLPIMIFFQGIVFPSSLAVISNLATAQEQGEILGINNSISSLANALPPILFGYAVGMKVTLPIWFGAICTFIAWGIYFRFYKINKQKTVAKKEKQVELLSNE